MNQWITDNSSIVNFLNVVVIIFLTILNVWFAKNSQKYSAHSLMQNERIRRENNTPNIIAYLDTTDLNFLSFKLSNIGINAAKNIKINLAPMNQTKTNEILEDAFMFKEGVAFLAPNQTLSAHVGSFVELMNDNKDFPTYEVSLAYQDIDQNHYNRTYVIDSNMYNGYYGIMQKNIHDLNKEMKKIEGHFKKTVKIMEIKDKRDREYFKNIHSHKKNVRTIRRHIGGK
ncbi:hypothetical protein [Paenibacillus glacialis]|uniref:Uncharacterized protein n=1 Tax=Paenibacillus glacialis TaxID=494026 RepID=A0A168NP89_9BACL|nr:hypothetical protein [Paenibacillus glacialis]OAB45991.1 hypothetical protein PGLA_00920 [Paenibacillus glacialis]